ncbi:MAG: hypothetical protein AB7T49_20255 [Oligoflexales bacterium]
MSNISGTEISEAGDLVLQQIGVLNEATDHLEELDLVETVEPEEVGKWITVIGRALAAIFKI